MALGSTQSLTETSTRSISWGKGGRRVRLTLPPSCAVVMKSGNLNFLGPSGPLQACSGTDLPLIYLLIIIIIIIIIIINWVVLDYIFYIYISYTYIAMGGGAVAHCWRYCATNRKVVGSIPAGVIGIFHWHKILPIALWPWGRLSL